MSDIILGCDLNNASADRKHQKEISKLLENAGHTVKILGVGPGATQKEMRKKTSKGKIAVFLINGADLQTYKDFWQGMTKGYYYTKYCYFGLQGYANKRTMTCQGAKTTKLKKAHDDASSVSFTKELVGMTTHEVMEKYKSKIAYACGSTVSELGNNLVQVIGGGTNTTSSANQENYGTIRDALTDVLYGWDGEVECFLREDTVYIRKIKSPTAATLKLIEGENVNLNSVTVTDVNPSNVNYLTGSFKGYELSLKDDSLIKRFGKISKKITVPNSIKTLSKAKEFLQREWVKNKRDNGHILECSTQGHTKWKNGWCRVYFPSFNIDDYMYITKISQDESQGEWDCKLTLVDYPPGFGEPNNQNNNESKKNSTDSKTNTNKTTKKSTSSNNSSSANTNSQKTTKKTSVAKKGTVKKKESKVKTNTYRKKQLLG